MAGPFDIILAIGVVHHLDDGEAAELFRVAVDSLSAGGRLVTFDGVYVNGQSPIARFLLSQDRGRYVRRQSEYERLAHTAFVAVESHVTHDFIAIPYSHLIMECVKP